MRRIIGWLLERLLGDAIPQFAVDVEGESEELDRYLFDVEYRLTGERSEDCRCREDQTERSSRCRSSYGLARAA